MSREALKRGENLANAILTPLVSDCQYFSEPPPPFVSDCQHLLYLPPPLCQRLSAFSKPPSLPCVADISCEQSLPVIDIICVPLKICIPFLYFYIDLQMSLNIFLRTIYILS